MICQDVHGFCAARLLYLMIWTRDLLFSARSTTGIWNATSNHWDLICLPYLKTRMIMHVNIEEHLLCRMLTCVLKDKSLVHVVPKPVKVSIACGDSCFYRWFKVGNSAEWWAVRPMEQECKVAFLSHMYSSQTCHSLFTKHVWKCATTAWINYDQLIYSFNLEPS